jgi:hypothetical protein
MEDAAAYAATIEEALEKKLVELNTTVLPAMQDHFRVFLTTFEGPYNILVKKGAIREDPYKLEEKLSEIRLPSRERFPPSDLEEQMGIRLSQYHSQIDFLINYYEFSVSFLTLQRLRQLTALVKYLDFGGLVETSPNVNNAGLATLLDRINKGSDSVAISIAKDGVIHLADLSRRILKCIADLALYQRERYKLELRSSVIPAAGLDASRLSSDQASALQAIQRQAKVAGMPYYQELAGEVLAEDYPADAAAGGELRARVLARLKVEEQKREKPKATGPTPRELLLDAVKVLCGSEASLRSALKAVRDGEELVARQPLTLGERVRRFFARAAGSAPEEKTFEIEYMDDSRGEVKVERVAYSAFVGSVGTKVKSLQALATKNTQANQKLLAASDDQLFESVTRLAAEITGMTKRLEGLSNLFRSQVSPEHRSQFRGIHPDLAAIRGAVSRANRQKHEYVSRREEEEQFKKLGIAPGR